MINSKIKELSKMINSITEEEQEFTPENFLQMKEFLRDINCLKPFTNWFVSIMIDGKMI